MTKWIIDPGHSDLRFSIRHLAIAKITGHFRVYQGTVATESDDFENATVSVRIDAAGIDTNNDPRDNHLRSADFLDAERYETIDFNGRLKENVLDGELTIRGVTKPVRLNAEFLGFATGRFGDSRAGFEVTGKLRRGDWGLTWNILAEGGGLTIGDDINLSFALELIKK